MCFIYFPTTKHSKFMFGKRVGSGGPPLGSGGPPLGSGETPQNGPGKLGEALGSGENGMGSGGIQDFPKLSCLFCSFLIVFTDFLICLHLLNVLSFFKCFMILHCFHMLYEAV